MEVFGGCILHGARVLRAACFTLLAKRWGALYHYASFISSGRSGCMIAGSMVALVTPMDAQGGLDWESLSKLVDFHLQEGTNAIVAVGTTGESATLSVAEHIEVIRRVVDQVNGRIPVIAGTGANSTSEAVELTENAKTAGADACLLVTPYYNKPTQEGLYLHFKHIAEAVAIPQILYNVPGRTVCDMLPDTVERLSKISNIIGIKEATGDLKRGQEVLDRVSKDFLVYSGDDPTAVELMLMGGKGNISVTANVAPRAMSDLCAAAMAGDADTARAINERLMPLHRALFLEANPIPVKWALHEMGLMGNGIRLPLTWLSQGFQEPLRQAMRQTGVLA